MLITPGSQSVNEQGKLPRFAFSCYAYVYFSDLDVVSFPILTKD